jgi:hypothetical protein
MTKRIPPLDLMFYVMEAQTSPTHVGDMDFGFIGNGNTMYDLPQLARHVRDAYAELDAAASKRRPAAATATRTRSAASQH